MKIRFSRIVVAVLLTFLLPSLTIAQTEQTQTAPAGPQSGFRAEFLQQLEEVQKKLVDLAEAVPADKYSWRPVEGVRSISEVYVHIAVSNFLLLQFIGVLPPGGISGDLEKTVTEKSKVIELLKKSFEHVRQAVLKTSDADLEKRAKFFERETSVRDVFFGVAMHMHEHLGQSIAYARSNDVVPPWSAASR